MFTPLLTTNSNETNFGLINNMVRDLNAKEVTEIFKDDAATRRVLLGKGANGFYGLKVSPAGVDVYDATDDQLIFNSGQNVFKIVNADTVPISHSHTANSARSTSVPHGQSGVPVVVAFANDLVAPGVPTGVSYNMPFLYPAVSGGNLVISTYLYLYVDGTNITVASWSANVTTIVSNVRYYILQETAA